MAVLPAPLRMCITVPEACETTNGNLQNDVASTKNYTACINKSVHLNSSSAGSVKGVKECAALASAVASTEESSVTEVPGSHPGGKLQQVLNDLKIADFTVPEEIEKKLVKVVNECLDAFAASGTEFGPTSVIT